MLTRNGQTDSNGKFDWSDACIDAGIVAGLTFFTTLGASGVIGTLQPQAILTSGIAAASQFFLWLALKRGLKKETTEQ